MQTIWKYDYAGIVVLIVASFIPPVYYGFLCEPLLRNFYLISTCLMGKTLDCICCTFFSMHEGCCLILLNTGVTRMALSCLSLRVFFAKCAHRASHCVRHTSVILPDTTIQSIPGSVVCHSRAVGNSTKRACFTAAWVRATSADSFLAQPYNGSHLLGKSLATLTLIGQHKLCGCNASVEI